MTWQWNGADLTTSTVTVTVEPGAVQEDQGRTWATAPPDAFPELRTTGHQVRPFNAVFRFTGPAPERYERLEYLRGLLQQTHRGVLTADDAGEVYFLNGARSIALHYDGMGQAFEDGVNTTALNVRFLTLGTPAEYVEGGSFLFCEEHGVQFLANDFFTATDDADYADAALLGLPVQKSGFPKATNPSTLQEESLSLLSAEIALNSDGIQSIVEVYDLAGYVTEEPHSEGEGGTAYVCPCADRAAIAAYGVLLEVCAATVSNDFSITQSSTGFLIGVAAGRAVSILYGPAGATIALVSTETALDSDGTSSTVNVYEVTGDDGCYILEVS